MENDLRNISSGELVANTRTLVEKERELGVQVLKHLREIDRRGLFAERGYTSLHEFCVKELKYSDGAAHRRVSAMRLIRDVPEAEAAIAQARISMTNAAMLQTFLRSERAERRKTYTVEEKQSLLTKIEGKSSRECEKTLAAISPQAIPRERERVLSETETEIRFVANARVQKMLHRLRELTAHSVRSGGYAELIEKSLEIALKAIDPMKQGKAGRERKAPDTNQPNERRRQTLQVESVVKHTPSQSLASAPKLENDKRYTPRSDLREVWRRDQGRCAFTDSRTGRRCESRHGLQVDHIQPLALGGETTATNLRLLCHAHNQLLAIREFGPRKMAGFVPALREGPDQRTQ